MAFKPTRSLNSRIEARLKGWRTPAVKILRQETKNTNALALDPAFRHVNHWEPRKGLMAEEAYKMMGLPMQEVLEKRGGTRRDTENADVLQTRRIPQPKDEPQEVEELELGVAKAVQKRPQPGPFRPLEDRRVNPIVSKVNSMRYKPPATNYWRHSIYTYDKNAIKCLPATTVNANKLIRAYFNMAPKQDAPSTTPSSSVMEIGGAGPALAANSSSPDATAQGSEEPVRKVNKTLKDVEEENRRKLQTHKTNGSRIYVQDRGYRSKGMIRQDVLGKISMRMQPKATFHYPYRDVQDAAPQITFKHYRDGIGISVHVHEGMDEGPSRRQQRQAESKGETSRNTQ